MSEEAPCRYCGHWDAPNDEKTYCLKHYRRTFPDKGCDICELEAELAAIKKKACAAVNAPYEDILDMGLAQALRELKETIPE